MVISTWGLTTGDEYVSPERILQLEKILFEKVRQRTLTKENEVNRLFQSKTILNTFKYYDIEKRGYADLNCFVEILKYYGCSFNKNEIQALFNRYD